MLGKMKKEEIYNLKLKNAIEVFHSFCVCITKNF